MLFNSVGFLFAFLPTTYAVYWLLRGKNARYAWLTLTGYVFYSFWNPKFCLLMAFSTLVSYAAGRGLLAWDDPRRRKLCLILPITVDLLLLAFFKYAGFLVGNVAPLIRAVRPEFAFRLPDIVLPVGISFYTFHTITYIVDAYERRITPTKNLLEFSCYVSLFSQLVAGPIVRFRQIEADLEQINRADRVRSLDVGWSFFGIGLMKKVLLADTIARIINPALADVARLSSLDAWLCALGYTYQLYFDFSGYSDMAVGLGLMFGLRLPQNFDSPYRALDPSDFWRRWHISLSTVLRDYLYIPLGGNRGGTFRTFRNIMITTALGGLWHGANWTFVLWGCYHGVLLILHRIAASVWKRMAVGFQRAITFFLVVLGWVLFRSTSFGMAGEWLRAMFLPRRGIPIEGTVGLAAALTIAALAAHVGRNTFEIEHRWSLAGRLGIATGFSLAVLAIIGGRPTPFLYFQF